MTYDYFECILCIQVTRARFYNCPTAIFNHNWCIAANAGILNIWSEHLVISIFLSSVKFLSYHKTQK